MIPLKRKIGWACTLLVLFAGVGCSSGPDPEVLAPYETIHKERMALREEIINILDSINSESTANRAIPKVLKIRARQKVLRNEKEALGPTPNDVKKFIWDHYHDYEMDLKNREDAAAQRAASIPGSANFFKKVPFFKFKMMRKPS